MTLPYPDSQPVDDIGRKSEPVTCPGGEGSASLEADRHALLAEIGLHELAALAVVLGELCGLEHGFLGAFAGHRALQRRDMGVEVAVVVLDRGVDGVDRLGDGKVGP